MALTDRQRVGILLGAGAPPPPDQVDALIDYAEAAAVAEVQDIRHRCAVDEVYADLVRSVLASVVVRVLRNPDGLLEVSIDDYRERRDSATSTGQIMLTEYELHLLRSPAEPKDNPDGAFSVTPWRK
jgi:hypothetical protein